MSYTIEQIDSSEKVEDGKFTGSTGLKNPSSRGLIFEEENVVSVSFGYSPAYTPTDEQLTMNTNTGTEITTCFEGPLVKLWWDSEGNEHLSTTNKLDCYFSYWGNKEEKFGELFYCNGGLKFFKECKDRNLTHHFMIMTPALMVTSELNLRDNKCMVIYLGSMSKDGFFSNIDFTEDVFYKQVFNTIPLKEELGGKVLYPYVWKVDDVPYYINFIKQVLSCGYEHNTAIVDALTQDEKFKGVDKRVIDSYFGSPVIIRSDSGILKYTSSSYDKKCSILGNSPNIKLQVYNLMDDARPKKDIVLEYFEKYDFLFVPDQDFLNNLKNSENVKSDIISKYRELGTVGFMDAKNPRNNDTRERNLLLVLLLCLPQCKAKIAIESYQDYLVARNNIKNFVKLNLRKIIEGKYDEPFGENSKAIRRLKDISSRSLDYTRENGKGHESFTEKLEFSLKGLTANERGASLYKINKVLNKFI